MDRRTWTIGLAAMTAVACAGPSGETVGSSDAATPAEATVPADAIQVMILGTFHFADPDVDMKEYPQADPLSETRQREIEELVERLAAWGPTKIGIEATRDRQAEFDSAYAAYRTGDAPLNRNERRQVGFRLAAHLDLPRLFTIDYRGTFPFGPVMDYAEQHDTAYVAGFDRWLAHNRAMSDSIQRTATLREILLYENDPGHLRDNHARYLTDAQVADDGTQVGADFLTAWYERNIHIYTNITAICEPGDRVLVVIGSGHAPILRELIRGSPGMVLVEPRDVI